MIRYGNIDDLDIVCELLDDVKNDLNLRNLHFWSDDYPNREIMLEDLEENHAILNFKNGKLAGYMALSFLKDEYEETYKNHNNFIFLTRVMVSTSFRRMGIAKELFEFIFKQNYDSFRITVSPINLNAKRLYESLGFKYLDTKEYSYGKFELLERISNEYNNSKEK